MAAARERRLLAVEREPSAGHLRVLERTPHQPGRGDRDAVVAEPGRACVGKLRHLRELGAALALRDRGEEADRHLGLGPGPLDERAQHGRRVDDRLGVRHREDRAEAARGRGPRAGGDRLLVLAPRRPQVDVRVDERGREDQARAVHDAVPVGVHLRPDLRDEARVGAHVEERVRPLHRVDDARAADDEVVEAAVLREKHHATSTAATAWTPTGPPVSRS